jgi:flagellar capping protein FliD
MGTLNFPGLATGIDTTEIIQQLMAIKSRPLANYKVKQVDIEQKQSTLAELKTRVAQFQTAASALSNADQLEVFSTSSSDGSRLSVAANEYANPGSHSVEINQLATSETWLQDNTTFNNETDLVGPGNFIYSYHYRERVLTTTDTTTLEELVGMINNDEDNPGVTASLLYQGDKYHLMLSGHDTGEDFQISINATSTEIWKPDGAVSGHTFTSDAEAAGLDTKLVSLDQWTGGHTGTETITITGKNNAGTTLLPARTLTIGAETTLKHLVKEVNSFFEGFATARLDNGQLVLTDHTAGTSDMEIQLSYGANGSGATLELPTMAVSVEGGSTAASIAQLNPASFVQTQNAQNSRIKIDNYTPTATAEVQTISPDAVATSGTFTLSYGGESTGALAYNASTSDIQTALNGLTSISAAGGVTVSGSTLAAGGDLTLTFASSAGNMDMVSLVSSLTGPTAVTVSETQRGSNEEWISRNANVVTDAITGLTLSLTDLSDTDDTTGDPIPIDITISRDNGEIADKVSKLVSAYNGVLEYLKSNTEYNAETKKMGILSNNMAVTMMKSQMRLPFAGVATGFSGDDPFDEATDIGLSFDGRGFLKFDNAKLKSALEENFMGTINLLGAQALGNSDSPAIAFNNSSAKYTTPGTYDVKVTVAGGVITSAQVKRQSESSYRDMTIADNLIIGNDSFTDDGLKPLYPENGLYLQVDLSTDGTFTAKVRVKQGIAGQLESLLDDVTKVKGRLDVSNETLSNRYNYLDRLIQEEESRLEAHESHLVQKFARLERILQEMQQQLSAVSIVSASVFGG